MQSRRRLCASHGSDPGGLPARGRSDVHIQIHSQALPRGVSANPTFVAAEPGKLPMRPLVLQRSSPGQRPGTSAIANQRRLRARSWGSILALTLPHWALCPRPSLSGPSEENFGNPERFPVADKRVGRKSPKFCAIQRARKQRRCASEVSGVRNERTGRHRSPIPQKTKIWTLNGSRKRVREDVA